MKSKNIFVVLAVSTWIFLACQSAATIVSTATDAPSRDAATQPSIQTSSSTSNDCSIIVASYDIPHAATDIGGRALYDLAVTEPGETYLSASTIVMEARHLVSTSDGVDGTLVLAYIGDLDGDTIKAHALLVYLPDEGDAVNQLPVDSQLYISGPYVGYVYPPKNLFTAFPNENEDTKFPSIQAETASYGCPP